MGIAAVLMEEATHFGGIRAILKAQAIPGEAILKAKAPAGGVPAVNPFPSRVCLTLTTGPLAFQSGKIVYNTFGCPQYLNISINYTKIIVFQCVVSFPIYIQVNSHSP